jgi:hypothetical protein
VFEKEYPCKNIVEVKDGTVNFKTAVPIVYAEPTLTPEQAADVYHKLFCEKC